MLIEETYIQRTVNAKTGEEESVICGESGLYEPMHSDDPGKLFRLCQREHGRCVSRVYIDRKDGGRDAIGWVFQKRKAFEDAPKETYLAETWITLHEKPPTVTRKVHHYVLRTDRS